MKSTFENRSQRERMAISEALIEALGEKEENERFEIIKRARSQLSFGDKKAA